MHGSSGMNDACTSYKCYTSYESAALGIHIVLDHQHGVQGTGSDAAHQQLQQQRDQTQLSGAAVPPVGDNLRYAAAVQQRNRQRLQQRHRAHGRPGWRQQHPQKRQLRGHEQAGGERVGLGLEAVHQGDDGHVLHQHESGLAISLKRKTVADGVAQTEADAQRLDGIRQEGYASRRPRLAYAVHLRQLVQRRSDNNQPADYQGEE
eukprot:ctg_94.g64